MKWFKKRAARKKFRELETCHKCGRAQRELSRVTFRGPTVNPLVGAGLVSGMLQYCEKCDHVYCEPCSSYLDVKETGSTRHGFSCVCGSWYEHRSTLIRRLQRLFREIEDDKFVTKYDF